MRKQKQFRPPKDVKQWWMAPHCGPGSLDPQDTCGFCGETHLDCALSMTLKVKEHPDWLHDGGIMGDGQDDPETEMACGGSGFWCSECGRFWAQDNCGNTGLPDPRAADGAETELRDGKIYCVCGKQVARLRPDPKED